MGRTGRIVALVLAVMGAASPAFAQWLRYPTDGIPRTRDGKPNLSAPAPRLPDGKPDLSGIWHSGNRIPCSNDINRFIECGAEIGGAKLTLGLRRDSPPGAPPPHPRGAPLQKKTAADDTRAHPHPGRPPP